MRVQDVLAGSIESYHGFLEQTMADVTSGMLGRRPPGATINTIGVIYAHIVYAQDFMVNKRFQANQTLFQSGGWARKLGIVFPETSSRQEPDWALSYEMKLFREYADAVFASTQGYLMAVPDADLELLMPAGPLGELPAATMINNLIFGHLAHHTGEIAALKGVMGTKGFPF